MKKNVALLAICTAACFFGCGFASAASPNETQTWSLGEAATSAAVSPDGSYSLMGTKVNDGNEVYLFSPNSNTPYQGYNLGSATTIPQPNVNSVSISSSSTDGPYFSVGAGNKAYFFKRTSATALGEKSVNASVLSVSISSDGVYTAAGTDAYGLSNSGAVYLYKRSADTITQQWYSVIETDTLTNGVNDRTNSVSISGDGAYIVVGSENKNIYLYSSSSKNVLWGPISQSAPVTNVALSRNGRSFAASFGQYVIWYNVSTHEGYSNNLGAAVSSISISDDGMRVAACAGKGIYVLNSGPGLPIRWNATMPGTVNRIAISGDGRYVIAGDNSGNARFFYYESNKEIWTASTGGAVRGVALSGNGDYAVAGGDEKKAHLYTADYRPSITSDVGQASIKPGSSFTYNLNVTNTGNRYNTIMLSVQANSTNYHWGALSKSSVALAPGGSEIVNYVVAVPSGEPAGKQASITIAAQSLFSSSSPSVTVRATVSQVYGAQLSNIPQSPVLFNQGESKSFSITVKNSGNGQDTIFLSASAPNGWEAALEKSNLALSGQDYDIVKMTVKVPSYATEGTTATISITARPNSNNGEPVTATFNAKISAHPAFSFSLASGQNSTMQIKAGQVGIFNFMVSNQGNSAITATISSSNAGAVFDMDSVILAPGESKQVAMTVSVPQTATEDYSVPVTASVSGLQPVIINCFVDVIPAEQEQPKPSFIPGFELAFLAAALCLAVLRRKR